MGMLDNIGAAPQITPDIMASMSQPGLPMPALPRLPQQGAAAPMPQPMPQAPAPQQRPTGPKVLDPALAQKNPALVVPGVVINGHVFRGGDKADDANWQMLTGDDYMKTIPQAEQLGIKQMVEGRMPFPGSNAIKTPYWQQKLAAAQQYDPNFDAATWETRVKTLRDYTPNGGAGKTLLSGSTVINHLGHLFDQVDTVSGWDAPLIGEYVNHGINAWNAPNGKLAPYKDTQGHVAEEATKFYRGTGGSEEDIRRNMENTSPDLSRASKIGAVDNTVKLVYGKLKPMADAYNTQMGTNFPASHFISPDAVKTLRRMGYDPDTGEKVGSATGPQKSQAPQVPGASQTKIIDGVSYHLVGGKWMQ